MTTSVGATNTLPQSLLNSMNGTASTAAAASAGTGSAGGASSTSAAGLQSTFLKLLVTQMQNQDPTNPMDSSQMTSQLAQINTVTGISQLNTTLQSLATQLNATQQVQASSLIGKTVLVPGSSATVTGGTPTATGVKLDAAASAVGVTITDASGRAIKTLALGAQPAGTVNVNWDGTNDQGVTVANGIYKLSVTATQAGQAVGATMLSAAQVSGVTTQADGSAALLTGNGLPVAVSSIAQIL